MNGVSETVTSDINKSSLAGQTGSHLKKGNKKCYFDLKKKRSLHTETGVWEMLSFFWK